MGHFQVRKLLVYQRVMTEFSSPLSFGELPHVSFQLPSACHAECHGYMKTGGMTHPPLLGKSQHLEVYPLVI